ncbi:MAG: hypothetical protein KGI29_02575 [Pseudomonadota bacterium]|nr:hypothetical protein [Pseudomonadota bacterium]MDE3037514.1 hypothetical protein [Pseudomonadota bacterium]
MTRRVIIVHTIEHVESALAAAAESGKPVILQSAPEAIFYAGSLYLLHMYGQAKKYHPGVSSRFILDCGDAGAEAVAALQLGHMFLRSSAPPEIREKLADIAGQIGAELISGEYEALDLLPYEDTKDLCIQWLKEAA